MVTDGTMEGVPYVPLHTGAVFISVTSTHMGMDAELGKCSRWDPHCLQM